MGELSTSARFVLEVISQRRVVKFKELQEATGLPTRTLRYALRVLRESGYIKVFPCLDDARERLYVIDECYKLSGS
ncbi:MAG: winged helix-turn-helix transcriptional regulator [Sulfolobus sp.]|nr:winged helix-turn-helix transcriptional regulator [Sulfolobus sp.]